MSLYKRKADGPYWVRISVAGAKIRKSAGTTDRAEAKEFEQRERDRAYRELKLGDRSAVQWRQAAARWLIDKANKRSIGKDEYMLAWFGGFLDDEPLSAIDRDLIDDLRDALIEDEGSSESNVDRYMQLMRAILRKCRDEWGYLDKIPKVPMYGSPEIEPRWLSRAEFDRLVVELPPHLKLAARFAVLTGLRMRAMLKLTWSRVDLVGCRAWIPANQSKAARTFGFPLSTEAVKVLKECREAWPNGPFVFQYQNGRREFVPYDDANGAAFRKAVERAGVAPLRWHDLRHTFASWAIQGGVSLQELMQLGDWKSFAMVLRYAHLAPDQLAAAAQKLVQNGHTAKRSKRKKAA